MTRLLAVTAVLLGAGCLLAAAPDARPAAPDFQDFVYFGDSRPFLIRVHAEIDGRPVGAAWDDFIDRLFAHLDVDGDGALSRDEAARAPTPQALFNNGFAFFGPAAAPSLDLMYADGDGKVSRDRLAAWFRRVGGAPFQLQLGAGPAAAAFTPGGRVLAVNGFPAAISADAVNDAFWDLLDTDKDGKLSREELAAAPEILMKLDADEDETVSLSELMPKAAQPATPPRFRATAPPGAFGPSPVNNGPFLMATPAETSNLVRQLQTRYGKGAVKLTRKDLGLERKTFDLLDADKDGGLDEEELAHFTERPADLELKVRLGRRSVDEPMVEATVGEVGAAADGAVRAELSGAWLEFRGVRQMRPPSAPDFVRQQYLAQFKAADRDGNGYLDEREAAQSPVFQGLFKAMDRDGDGKLFEKEVIAYLDALKGLQEAAASSCVTASFADEGRGLFDLVDTDRDGRLSLREMRQMTKLIERLDKDGDGKISRSEIQKSYQVVFREGAASAPGFGPVVFVTANGVTVGPAAPAPRPEAGPLWFRKMDRNHDGDVSRREFLGTDEEFKRLDLDGDGLISVDEAEKADAATRQAPK